MFARRRLYALPLPDGRVLELGERTLVMGILNVTPDSFADGGRYLDAGRAVEAGLAMAATGADVLDVGGESTRPGAAPVEADEERRRVIPIVQALAAQLRIPISVDTYKADVAAAAVDAGAVMVNDVSGLQADPRMGPAVARCRAALVVMHSRGASADMYARAAYDDVCAEVAGELGDAVRRAEESGVVREAIVIDPGIGFAKRAVDSLALLSGLDHPALVALDRPFLVGPSRKSFLTKALGDVPPPRREWGTAAAVTAAILAGAHIVRVHGVAEMAQVARVADELLHAANLSRRDRIEIGSRSDRDRI